MLRRYEETIEDIAVVYAHVSRAAKGENGIYAVAARRFGKGGSGQFESLVRFDGYTARDRYRSNLSKAVLQSAAPRDEVRRRLVDFLGGVPVLLAFSEHSDLEALQRFCGVQRCVDLNFAAEFFLQELSSHSFLRLWEKLFSRSHPTLSFTAAELVALSEALIRHICWNDLNDSQRKTAGVTRHFLEQSRTLFGQVFCRLTRSHRDFFGGLLNPTTGDDSDDWRAFLDTNRWQEKPELPDRPAQAVPADVVRERFAMLARAVQGFTLRPSQLEYAGHVVDAFNSGAALCVEAGTGTGKTQGYLLPVLEFLRRNRQQRAVVSTYTKRLQEQIVDRELAALKEAFPIYRDIPVALLKGKASYVCAEKLDVQYEPDLSGASALAWTYLLGNLLKFPHADLDGVGGCVRKHLNRGGLLLQLVGAVSAREG